MSKAIKAVTGAVGSVFGAGTSSSGLAGTGSFKASTRKIDKDAFKIKNADDAAKRSKEQETSAANRSQQAQSDRAGLVSQLQAQAAGTAPSLAEAQLKSASDRSLAQQLAASQSQRGGSASSRERQLLRNQASAGREIAQDSATARMQEQQAAQQQLGTQISQEQQLADQLTQNYLAQGFNIEQAQQQALADYEKMQTDQFLAAQGVNLSGFQSAANNRAQMFGGAMQGAGAAMSMLSDKNAKKKIKKMGSKDVSSALDSKIKKVSINKKEDSEEKPKSGFAKFMSENKDASGSTKSGQAMGYALGSGMKFLFSDEEVKINKKEVKESDLQKHIPTPAPAPTPEKKDSGMDMSAMAKLAGPAMAAMSDKKSKTNMEAYSDKNIKKDFLDKLEAYTYEYKNKYKKDPRAGEGTHMSVMAQDLEKAGSIGKSMVQSNEEGIKQVDYAKGYGAILAAQAHLNKRLDELESKKKKGK